jgi:hypothetical protein
VATNPPPGEGAAGISAGLYTLAGVFGYMTSLNAASAASSRADLIRMESEANAQRYSEQASQFAAQQKVMYLGAGVKLSGSPLDVLNQTARIASENIDSIKMQGQREALDQSIMGQQVEVQGRDKLLSGLVQGFGPNSNFMKVLGSQTSTGT